MANREDAAGGRATPIEQGLIARVVQGVRYIVGGAIPQVWFGPQQPIQPIAQSAEGRAFDYPVGYNLRYTPRAEETVSFQQLRALADAYDLMRLVIETRKDQLVKLKWAIAPKDKKAKSDDRCKEVSTFFMFPDKEHGWQQWLRMVVEDLLVIDAPTIYPRRTIGGDMYSLDLVDGSTIKRVLDEDGRTPLPPSPAYQQILKGVPAVDYTRDTLVYFPRNVRTHKVYGQSPVEQVVMTVNIALRRQLSQLQYYTEGNIPEALIGVPETWNVDQIKQFQLYWDSLLEGNTALRRHAKFVPGKMEYKPTRESVLKDEYDEWLARVVCFAFSISPTPFIAQVNRATASTAQETAVEEGLMPLQQWVADLMSFLMWKYWGYYDLEFRWEDQESIEPLERAQINQIYLSANVKTDDEVRAELGLDPLTPEQRTALPSRTPTTTGMGDEEETPSAKLAKGKKKVLRPIKKDRAKVSAITQRIEDRIESMLSAQLPYVSQQLAQAIHNMGKADADVVQQILDVLNLENFAIAVAEDAKLIAAIEDMLNDGGAIAMKQLGIESEAALAQVNVYAAKYARQRAAEMVGKKRIKGRLVNNPKAEWDISEGTRERLRGVVSQAIDGGWDNDQLAAAIQQSGAFSAERASMIARTETAMADMAGNMAAYRESGVVEGKEWILGGNPCVVCVGNANAGVIGLDELFPSGDDAVPAHPNCECDVIPVLID